MRDKKKKKEGGSEKRGGGIHPFHLPWIRERWAKLSKMGYTFHFSKMGYTKKNATVGKMGHPSNMGPT